jgi:hypothetical protein
VAVDAAGAVYVVNLAAGGIHVHRSGDRGATWTYLGDLAGGAGADRPWVAARGGGEVVVAWHQGGVSHVRASRDGGASWTEAAEAPADASQLGAIVLRDECWCADVPLVLADEGASGLDGTTFGIHVAHLDLDSAEWTVQDTQARWQASATGLHTSGSLVFPTLARSGDGTWAIAWSEEQNAPGGGSSTAARVKVSFSADGAAWTAPSDVTPTTSAVMPWLAGGPKDRFLLAVYTSDLPLDTDYVGRWDVRLLALEAGTATVLQAVVAADVHAGGICTRGTLCPAYASDRALLDNLEVAVGPDFAVGLAFGADPPTDAKRIAIRALAASWDPART